MSNQTGPEATRPGASCTEYQEIPKHSPQKANNARNMYKATIQKETIKHIISFYLKALKTRSQQQKNAFWKSQPRLSESIICRRNMHGAKAK